MLTPYLMLVIAGYAVFMLPLAFVWLRGSPKD